MTDDFATDPSELAIDFWNTTLGKQAAAVISAISRGDLPETAVNSFVEVLNFEGTKLKDLTDFSSAEQATKLANLLQHSLDHYMPNGVIDDDKASASDIKNIISTASSAIKLIHTVQKDLYTQDRSAAMEKAITKTFDTMVEEVEGVTPEITENLKKHFRQKLEVAFSSL